MNRNNKSCFLLAVSLVAACTACKVPSMVQQPAPATVPASFENGTDTANAALIPWRDYFNDSSLAALIDTALKNNQDLLITLQDIEIARNDIRVKKGNLLPFVTAGGGAGVDKVGRYTSQGAGDASTDITPGKGVPDWLTDQRIALTASWEADIWKKLRNEKQAAAERYLASVEGKHFVVTNLVAEIASRYYELLALDNRLQIVRQTIQLQQQALEVVKIQKQAARVNELAVQKFAAEVEGTRSLEAGILQQIRENENQVNFLLGRYPQPVVRDSAIFLQSLPQQVSSGIPSQLLQNRPDIRQAERELSAAQFDVQVARKEFYPSFEISSVLGFNAFRPSYLVKFPESLIFSLAGDLAGPLINKNAIQAQFSTATALQLQALYNYEKSVLNGYIEVSTGLANISNLQNAYVLKSKQVEALLHSVDIANELFRADRADYFEVLMTQRDMLGARLDLNETRLSQWQAITNIYRSLGGGWR